jgi:hypothetical protein
LTCPQLPPLLLLVVVLLLDLVWDQEIGAGAEVVVWVVGMVVLLLMLSCFASCGWPAS